MAFVLRKYAKVGEKVLEGRRFAPLTPGGQQSPQQPGQLPDVSQVPLHDVLPVPLPADGPHRPISQHLTAEDRLGLWDSTGIDPVEGARFEPPWPPAYEEVRKATPWKIKPVRPTPGYALSPSGSRLSEQLAALAAAAEAAESADSAE